MQITDKFVYLPAEPSKRMLKAGYDVLSKIYPPKENGGEAIGQYAVYEAMRLAFIEEVKDLWKQGEYVLQ